jgi:membrane peptidoglycan carboxypeptidase
VVNDDHHALENAPAVAELIVGLVLIALCLGLVVDSLVVGAGLWVKHQSDEFVALPTTLDVSGVPERSALLDRTGHPFAYFWEQDRASVPASRMAASVRAAMVAVEDARFYDNHGVDLQATLRALVHNLSTGQHEGGSTITQQYVKNLLVTQARSKAGQHAATQVSSRRKLAEARFAVALDRTMSKDEILTGYLNLVFFGRGAYGVQAAAETFFGTDAGRLTLPQSALLAGLVKSPAEFDPYTHPAAALARRDLVLDRMVTTGDITDEQADTAKQAPLRTRNGAKRAGCPGSSAGYFCDWVQRQLLSDATLGRTPEERQHRLDTGGLVVRTTLDPAVQASTQRAVSRARGSRAALAAVVEQPGTGAVLAMAASVPFGFGPGESSVNLALGGSTGFQAGSTFKLFVLTQAVQDGLPLSLRMYAPQRYTSTQFAPYNIVNGSPTPYTVRNAADSESGVFTLEEATWHSVNTYYMQLEERVGFTGPARIAESMGVRRADGRPLQRVPSFTLGTNEVSPLAMAGAVATYSAHGRYCPAFGIADVVGGPEPSRPVCRQVLSLRVADTVTKVLSGVIQHGTGRNARVAGDAAGKTGTVQNFSAAWFIGYTPRYAAAVWMGDPRGGFGHPLIDVRVGHTLYTRMYGGDVPAQTWAALISGSPG